MPDSLQNYDLVTAISSRALFDLEKENELFENEGLEAFNQYQIEHQNDILEPGTGFRLVKKILGLNAFFEGERKVEVIVLTKNYSEASLRITNSIEHYGLDIRRSAWTGGRPITTYLKPFNVHLYLSANQDTVQDAIRSGIAAARIYNFEQKADPNEEGNCIRIAFDGDAVIFSDESERIYKQGGLEAFLEYEKKNSQKLLPDGPFANLLKTISILQKKFPPHQSPIRTALVTARGSDTHERVINTLFNWQVRVDETFFLGGVEKYQILEAFGADIFFDDQDVHCLASSKVVPTAIVPNEYEKKKV
jgi:5'-nucleotidase